MKIIKFLFYLTSNIIFCQSYKSIINFDASLGMPSDVVYSLKQDNDGYMWMVTDIGVAKYNGSSFKLFQIQNGLPSNEYFDVVIDSKNRKWLTGFGKGLLYIKDDKIFIIKNSKNISGLKFLFEKNGKVFFKELNSSKNYYVDNEGVLKEFFLPEKNNICLIDYSSHYDVYIGLDYLKSQHCILDSKYNIIKYIPKNLKYSRNLIDKNDLAFIEIDKGKEVLFSYSLDLDIFNKIVKIKNKSISSYSNVNINNVDFFKIQRLHSEFDTKFKIYRINESKVIVKKNGVVDLNLSKRISNLPCNLNLVYNIIIDKDENFWILYRNTKLTFIPNNYDSITNYYFEKIINNDFEKIVHFKLIGDLFYILTTENNFYCYNIKLKKIKLIKKYINTKPIKILDSNNTVVVYCKEGFDLYNIKGKNLIHQKYINLNHTRNCAINLNQIYYVKGASLYDLNKVLFKSENIRFNGICIVEDNYIAVSNENTIIKYNLLNNKFITNSSIPSTNIIHGHGNYLLAGTNNYGLYLLDQNLKIKHKINIADNIIAIYSNSSSNNIYIATNKLLLIYNLKNGSLKHLKTIHISGQLIEGKILSIDCIKNQVYVASSKGFSIINTNIDNKKTLSQIEIDKIFVNDSLVSFEKDLVLERNENNISIITSIFSFKKDEKFITYYSLSKDNSVAKWKKFEDNKISFKELPYGKYELKLLIKNENGTQISQKIKKIAFEIKPIFWETNIFKLLIIIIVVIIVIIIFKRQKESIKQKYALKLKLSTLELKALKAQMNPHFIFNTLNNIQSILFLEGDEKANLYIGKFSKLIRSTLELVNKEKISIHDEILYLKSYIDFQEIKNKFHINVIYEIEKDIDLKEIEIPVMLLQPIIENSILHGFEPENKNKIIKIIICKYKNRHLKIEIEDNGIGIKKSNSSKRNVISHKSFASSIIKERIKIMNSLEELNYEIEIHDLSDVNGENGTRVIIKIPILKNLR